MARLKKGHKVKYGVHIRAGDLRIDSKYQRNQPAARVEALIKNFNSAGFGELQISCRDDGSLWIIEGGHRAKAAFGIDPEITVPCTVHYDLTLSEEAHLFEIFNQTSSVSAIDKFKAGLVSGDPDVCSINNILQEFGLSVGTNKSDNMVLACPAALRAIVKRGGSDALRWVLDVVTDSWHWRYAVHQQVLLGMGTIYEAYNGKVDPFRLSGLLKKNTEPDALHASAKGRAASGERHAPRLFVADVIIGIYNKGKRSGNKLRRLV